MDLHQELSTRLAGRRAHPVSTGESGAGVWRCSLPGKSTWYLKAAPLDAQLRLDQEAACMQWMREHGLPAPAVREYLRLGDAEYLIVEAAVGVPASAREWSAESRRVAVALGHGLARLHGTDVTGCPFDRRVARQLDEARARIAAGHVREHDFDASRRGRPAAELFAELLTMVPSHEDLVFVHGDFCLPNVLLTRQRSGDLIVTGLVDCGRAGVGDRHQDLALAVRSLTYNLGPDSIAAFIRAYDGPGADASTLEFFAVLDEFF
jgi:aminoglycoside 3'-phosphotransferase II